MMNPVPDGFLDPISGPFLFAAVFLAVVLLCAMVFLLRREESKMRESMKAHLAASEERAGQIDTEDWMEEARRWR